MEIKEIVLRRLTAKNMCGYGVEQAEDASSVEDLINLMLSPKGIEFCMKYSFPKVADLLPYKQALLDKNVIVEGSHNLINPGKTLLVYGGEITVQVDGYNVCEVYATNDAKVTVIAKNNAYVAIESYKASTVAIERYDMAKIYRKD